MKNKKLIIIFIAVFCSAKLYSQIDSAKVQVDLIIANKNKYIGKPISILFSDIKYPYFLTWPRKAGNKRAGVSTYYEDEIHFVIQDTFPLYMLKFKLQNKCLINLDNLRNLSYEAMSNRIKYVLKKQIIVSLDSLVL